MRNKTILLLALTLFVCSFSVMTQNSPRATIEAFYRYDRSHSQTFNRRNIDARKRWFSAELYNLFLNELKREAAYLKKNPTDKPYFGDGLPFQPLQEKCEAGRDRNVFVQPHPVIKGDRARVIVIFAYPKPCKASDPVSATLGLVKKRSSWLIEDVSFGEQSVREQLTRKEY